MASQVLVFISHTRGMLVHPPGESFVEGAERAINQIESAKAHRMEYFPAADLPPSEYSIRQLRRADIVVAVIGFDYGSEVRDDPTRSYTELECDTAQWLGKPRLVFLLKPDAAHLQGINAARSDLRQQRFRRRLEDSGATVAYFDSVGDLKHKVSEAVRQAIAQRRPGTRTAPPTQISRPATALGCGGALAAVSVMAAVGVGVWSGITGSFPPWTPQSECAQVTAAIVGSSPSTFGRENGATLTVLVQNGSGSKITLPAARNIIATGANGLQYGVESKFADGSWFFDVDVEAGSSVRVKAGLARGDAGSDSVAVAVPDVRKGLPLLRCRVTTAPATVRFAG